jgi:hypothetical protein
MDEASPLQPPGTNQFGRNQESGIREQGAGSREQDCIQHASLTPEKKINFI